MSEITERKPMQMRLELHLPTGRPLVPVKAVMVVLDRSEDDVKYLVESGGLEYAWDLRGKGAERADLRVYRGSILHYLAMDYSAPRKAEPEAPVLRACLPPGTKPVRVSQLVRLWSASSTHLHNLLGDGLLVAVPGQVLKAKESPLLDRAAVVRFLQQRRVS